tara:strand:+ start:281 stop:469 length:189 start_codon:yes stop_codon:yes gene_type:complete
MQSVYDTRYLRIIDGLESMCATVHQDHTQGGSPSRHIALTIKEVEATLAELREISSELGGGR